MNALSKSLNVVIEPYKFNASELVVWK